MKEVFSQEGLERAKDEGIKIYPVLIGTTSGRTKLQRIEHVNIEQWDVVDFLLPMSLSLFNYYMVMMGSIDFLVVKKCLKI